jgi:hypothetical protein
MTTQKKPKLPPFRDLSPEESAEEFDHQARRRLGMSGEEFLRRWDAGEFPNTEDFAVSYVASLIPLVR